MSIKTKWLSCLAVALCSWPLQAQAKMTETTVDYAQGSQKLQGVLFYDTDKVISGKTPAVLVYHAWMGIGEHEKNWARQLAELGYVAFAADIYGTGIRPSNPEQAGKQAGIYRNDRTLMRQRAQAGLKVLQNHPLVDTQKIAALGFCFGGGVALELARSGAPVKGVISLHGNLDTPNPKDASQIKGKVLVLHGGDDPFVPDSMVQAFQQEMRQAKVNWQLTAYGGAVHAFTEPKAGNDPSKGAAYHPEAARKSWADSLRFLADVF